MFRVGDRVACHNGHRGRVQRFGTADRVYVAEDGGGTFSYRARELQHEGVAVNQMLPAPVAAPPAPPVAVAPQKPRPQPQPVVRPRFVAGRCGSGSR